jgi:prepilin-type processing-associated H-X9-DG protein
MAWMSYTQDYDERTPFNTWSDTPCAPNDTGGLGRGAQPIMFRRIHPYLKDERVLICPSDPTPTWGSDGVEPNSGCIPEINDIILPGGNVRFSYSSSDEAGGLGGGIGQPGVGLGMGVSMSGIDRPASMYLAFDSQRYYGTPEGNIDSFGWVTHDNGAGFNLSGDFIARHNGTVNCVFCDGHVKALHCSDMFPCERGDWIGQDINNRFQISRDLQWPICNLPSPATPRAPSPPRF